jgi:hypothetical protein
MRACLSAVLLVVMALLGAPSAVSAEGNLLRAAEVSPRTGTAATVFGFRVTYEGRFAASGVRVVVANLSLPMARTSGTASSGTWATSSTLPPGAWAVTFLATTAQGNAPALGAGTVTVAGGTGPTPIPTAGWSPDLPGPIATPAPSVAPAPVSPPPASPTTAPAVPGASSPAASDDPGLAPTASGGGAGAASVAPVVPGTDGSGDGAPAAPPSGPVPAASGDAVPAPTGGGGAAGPRDRPPETIGRGTPGGTGLDGLLGRDGPLRGVPAGTVWGVAAIALVGVLLLLAAWRRRAGTATDGPPVSTPAARATSDVDEALERRTRRRGRVRLDEDPIIAAMDLGGPHERPPRQRPVPVEPGPKDAGRDR